MGLAGSGSACPGHALFRAVAGCRRRRRTSRVPSPAEHHRGHVVAPRQVIDHRVQFVQRALVQRVDRRPFLIVTAPPAALPDRVRLHPEIAEMLEPPLRSAQPLSAAPRRAPPSRSRPALRIAQRGRVAEGDPRPARAPCAACTSPHGFRETANLDNSDGTAATPFSWRTSSASRLRSSATKMPVGRRPDEGERRTVPFSRMRRADDDHVAHGRVRAELTVPQDRAFDLLGAEPMAGDVDDVVAAAVQREAPSS